MVKYVLVVPQGGFNDCLCVISKAITYCKKYCRTLLLHMNGSMYKINFSDFFNVSPSIGCNIIYDFNAIKECLTSKRYSVYPSCLSNSLNDVLNNKVIFHFQTGTPVFVYNKTLLSLPLGVNEDIIIYSACGSGMGYQLFQNLTLKNDVKKHCVQRLAILSDNNYLCIHVRNTDYKCNYQKLYSDNKELVNSFGKIYVATDDKNVLDFFKSKHPNVFNFTQFPPDSKYRSLHTSNIDPIVKMNDMLCDIFIAANSKQILSNSAGGFIRLMRDCFANKGFVMRKLQ
jgi:hypothetical protein